jgi:osmotically-inducible protein OsmY
MKQMKSRSFLASVLIALTLTISSCGAKDEDVLKAYNDHAKTDGRLNNISASVKDGVMTLTGSCPDTDCRTYAEQQAKEIKGVKSVVNNIMVAAPVAPTAPVEISGDAALQTGVRDAVKDYPGVNATVSNGEVTLTGSIQRARLTNLMQSVQALNPRKVNNKLTIK